MATRSNIAYQRSNGQVVVAYCHWDGYPEHNGVMLNQHYNNQKKAEELANQGYFSGIKETLTESLSDRANEFPPITYHSAHTFYNDVQFDIEWIYLFKNNQWNVCVGQSTFIENDLQPLWTVLAKLEEEVSDAS